MTQAGPDVAQMLAMAAQAHATLALVAAQETANMIAYASHRIDHPMATQARTTTMLQMLGDLDFRIREDLHVNGPAQA